MLSAYWGSSAHNAILSGVQSVQARRSSKRKSRKVSMVEREGPREGKGDELLRLSEWHDLAYPAITPSMRATGRREEETRDEGTQ